MLLCTILFPILAGITVSSVSMERGRRHVFYAVVLAVTDLLAIASLFWGAPLRLFPLADGIDLYFALDGVGRYFLCAVLLLYTASCVYAFEYMKIEEREEAFFTFWFVSFGAVMAACMAGNLLTLYGCFELATLSSMPMVLHERTKEAVAAGLKYLFYSIGGALMGLLAIVALCYFSENANTFVPGGILDSGRILGHESLLHGVMFIGILGFGAKAGMYPLHGWLPTAHPIAPAPASALLSGIIAKLGILAVIRLVFFSAGPDLLRGTWVQTVWMCLAMLTIFLGSMKAFREPVMKKRLAYSSISQISYIMLGLSLLNEGGFTGGMIHLAAHAVSKGTLFLCAGAFIYKLGKRKAAELRGIGRQMPVTMWCFLIASLSLVGIPPMGGFVSKWFLAVSAVGNGMGTLAILPPVILLLSALLTAGYLLPVAVDAFFPGKAFLSERESAEESSWGAANVEYGENREPSVLMTVPLLTLCAAALCVGLFGSGLAELLRGVAAGLF